MKGIITNRPILIIGAAESLTDLGNWVTVLACFALIVFHSGGGAAESGGILLALLVPALPISPLAGWLSDRYSRKRLMIASKGLAALATLGLVFAGSLETIYAFLALQTAFSALVVPPRQASIYQLVEREELSRGNAFLQQLSGIVKIAGPLLAGALLAVVSPQTAIAIDAVCLVLAGLLLTALPPLPPVRYSPQDGADAQRGAPVAAGTRLFAALSGSSGLKWLFGVMLVDSAIVATFDVLGSIFTRDALGGDETLYSILISLVGVGAVASTLFLLLARRGRRLWRDVVLGVGLFGVMPASFVLVTLLHAERAGILVPLLLGAGAVLGGVANGFFGVQTSTLLQLLAPRHLLGRFEGLFQGTAVVGQLAAFLLLPLLVPVAISLGGVFTFDVAALAILAIVLAVAIRGQMHEVQFAAPQSVPVTSAVVGQGPYGMQEPNVHFERVGASVQEDAPA